MCENFIQRRYDLSKNMTSASDLDTYLTLKVVQFAMYWRTGTRTLPFLVSQSQVGVASLKIFLCLLAISFRFLAIFNDLGQALRPLSYSMNCSIWTCFLTPSAVLATEGRPSYSNRLSSFYRLVKHRSTLCLQFKLRLLKSRKPCKAWASFFVPNGWSCDTDDFFLLRVRSRICWFQRRWETIFFCLLYPH